MNARQYVQSLDLQYGETHRGNCPVCNGKKTFTATCTDTGVVYNCYKAGCGTGGSVVGSLTTDQMMSALRKRIQSDTVEAPKPIAIPEGFTKRVPTKAGREWLTKWQLDMDRHGLYYDVRQDRICFAVKAHNAVVDYVGRSMYNRIPKWLRYSNAHVPYTYGRGSCAVLVEDCISAVAAGEVQGCTGIALLGTNVIAEYLPILDKYDSVIIALDPDARSKALSMVKDLRTRYKNVYAFNSKDDLKYRIETDIINLRTMSER